MIGDQLDISKLWERCNAGDDFDSTDMAEVLDEVKVLQMAYNHICDELEKAIDRADLMESKGLDTLAILDQLPKGDNGIKVAPIEIEKYQEVVERVRGFQSEFPNKREYDYFLAPLDGKE